MLQVQKGHEGGVICLRHHHSFQHQLGVGGTWRHHYLVKKGGSAERVFGHHHPGLFLNPLVLSLLFKGFQPD